ncbi:hypothetical protein M3Y97_00169200 [Aphelenchoides bicaudatus]|nr:hypothetical protein M3Y97_00169200 [Aphelenchoides bicaudatus]
MATNTTQTIYILISLVTLATANLLLQPVEQLDKDAWCGPFRECPSGTQCMKLIDRSEPFSCFLPRYGSIVSFIEHHERMIEPRPAKSHHYEPLPIWLLASSSFGILCAASIVIWASFYVTRSLILCILRANCKQADQKAKAESVNQAFRRESNDPNDV